MREERPIHFLDERAQDRNTYRHGDWLIVKTDKMFAVTDDGDDMARVVYLPVWTWHTASRDGRVRGLVSAKAQALGMPKQIYLYQVRWMAHNYGAKPNIESLATAWERMHQDFAQGGLSIDHLNGCVADCRIQNLCPMTIRQNASKGSYQVLEPNIWLSVRAEDGLRVMCGTVDNPRYVLFDSVANYLAAYKAVGTSAPWSRGIEIKRYGYDVDGLPDEAAEKVCSRLLTMSVNEFERLTAA